MRRIVLMLVVTTMLAILPVSALQNGQKQAPPATPATQANTVQTNTVQANTVRKDTPSQADMSTATGAMSGAPMQGMDHSKMDHGASGSQSKPHHHEMGPHMKMTEIRPAQPGDADKAQHLVDSVRQAMDPYKDWHQAIKDGYKIFLPNIPQQQYHFTNWAYAIENELKFNPSHPTSLLYEKTGPNSYKLVGAMFTAPAHFSEDQINERVPLSVAQWHQHVNLCQPPQGHEIEQLGKNPRFGLKGSITTKEECDAAGGNFKPIIYNWMVHVYPYEKSTDEVWSLERQKMNDGMGGMDH